MEEIVLHGPGLSADFRRHQIIIFQETQTQTQARPKSIVGVWVQAYIPLCLKHLHSKSLGTLLTQF